MLAHAQKLARHACQTVMKFVSFQQASHRVLVKWIYILKMEEQDSQEREERLRRRQELERQHRARETAEQREIRLARRREQYRACRLARTFCMK